MCEKRRKDFSLQISIEFDFTYRKQKHFNFMVNGEIKINIDMFFNNEILARRAFGVFESCPLFEPKSWFPENQETMKQRVDFPLPFHKIRYLSNHAVLKRFNELFLSFLRTFSPTPCFIRSSPQCVKHLRLSHLFCASTMLTPATC